MKKLVIAVFVFLLGSYAMAIDYNSELLRLAALGNPDEIAAIIDKGANIESKDSWGETALILSSGNGKTDNVKFLLNKGSDINATSGSKSTALMRATAKGYNSVINVLLASGADVNKRNIKGFTAIMMAAAQGYVEIFQSLMRYDADVNIKNDSGQTALDLATNRGHMEIVKLLKQFGRTPDTVVTARKSELPEASGPNPVELVSFKKHGIRRVVISTRDVIGGKWPDEFPSEFPSGTEKLEVVLVLDGDPAYGVRLNTIIKSKSGKLDLVPQGPPGRFSLSGNFYLTQDIVPSAGKFTDDVYHCVVKLNGVNIAKFSWSVGSKEGS